MGGRSLTLSPTLVASLQPLNGTRTYWPFIINSADKIEIVDNPLIAASASGGPVTISLQTVHCSQFVTSDLADKVILNDGDVTLEPADVLALVGEGFSAKLTVIAPPDHTPTYLRADIWCPYHDGVIDCIEGEGDLTLILDGSGQRTRIYEALLGWTCISPGSEDYLVQAKYLRSFLEMIDEFAKRLGKTVDEVLTDVVKQNRPGTWPLVQARATIRGNAECIEVGPPDTLTNKATIDLLSPAGASIFLGKPAVIPDGTQGYVAKDISEAATTVLTQVDTDPGVTGEITLA